MPKEKFTPGPWRVHLDKRNGTVCAIIEDKSGDCVARTVYRFHRGERNANGHLIAAAPEMFEFGNEAVEIMRRIAGMVGVPYGLRDELEAQIKKWEKIERKAEGEE